MENSENKKNNFFIKNKVLIIILGIVLFLGFYSVNIYNKLVVLSEGVDNKWAQVDNQLQRRYDLIPNLVSSVKGAMKQEKEVFGKLAEARSHYAGAVSQKEKMIAGQEMGSALSRLLVVMENYPDLKSTETVKTLMAQLEGTENRLSVARKDYNDEVKSYNLIVKRFPTSLMAKLFGFGYKDYFKIESGVEKAPKVNF